MRAKHLGAGINLLSEERLGFVNLARHPDMLRALPRKHKNHRTPRSLLKTCQHSRRGRRFQRMDGFRKVAAHKNAAMLELSSTNTQGISRVGEVERRISFEVCR